MEVVGSVRRRKPDCGDVELLYVPKFGPVPVKTDLFETNEQRNLTDLAIADLERTGILLRRLNSRGHETFGEKIKLMRHAETGIPIDLFSTNLESWWNYLVCRTGPAESNVRICMEANARGWRWAPYSPGYVRLDGGEPSAPMESEEDVFRFVNLPFLPPEKR